MESGANQAMSEHEISHDIIKAGLKVHSVLGPGLLESTYKACLAYELRKAGLDVKTEVELPVIYDEVRVELGYRIDLLVNDCVIVELKCAEQLIPVLLTVRIFFFREDFRGDAAVSSFVNLSFGRSRFLCRYERARSPIPMLRFGMRAPRSPQHAQRQKRACRGPRFERALALRPVGIARG